VAAVAKMGFAATLVIGYRFTVVRKLSSLSAFLQVGKGAKVGAFTSLILEQKVYQVKRELGGDMSHFPTKPF